jgi:DNA invertase Pin-like site-specific DNA recombinase
MAGQRIGYVRVSTFDQNPERPLDMKQIEEKTRNGI